ncbi:GIY-YIG nuclease family protein [Nafulsella turpanensis]|uniref:GIY-YIG nuclease family protein n=1 Tax=Nafulsella turpanensis TaxID=1265690 RepID=UPI00034AEA8D|nr:GIY-YIG nuclease family protein [Nafulsella turpanensis]
MSRQHNYYVYITTNPKKTVLYTGMTNNLTARLQQHYANRGKKETFAGSYFCYCLLYYERHQYVQHAIEREKEIKGYSRQQKEDLISEFNPEWNFLNVNE